MQKKRKQYVGSVLFDEKDSSNAGTEASTVSVSAMSASDGNNAIGAGVDAVKQHDAIPCDGMVHNNDEVSYEASPQELDFMRLLKLQEDVLTKHEEVIKAIEKVNLVASNNENRLEKFKLKCEEISKDCETLDFNIRMSKESHDRLHKMLDDETKAFSDSISAITTREIYRLQKAIDDERMSIDIIRLRWYPQGYILVVIFSLMLCIIFALVEHLMK